MKAFLSAFFVFLFTTSLLAQIRPDLIVSIGHSELVSQVTVSPDNRFFATSAWDNSVKLWDISTGREIRTFRTGNENNMYCVAFSPDGKTIAGGSFDKKLHLWDVESGTELAVITGHNDWVTSVVFAPDGKTVFTASPDKTIRQWDMATGKEIRKMTGHDKNLAFLAVTPDQKTLVSGSFDNTIKFWSLENGKNLGTVKTPDSPRSFAFSADGSTLLIGCRTGSYPNYASVFISIDTRDRKEKMTAPRKGPTAISFSANGNFFTLNAQNKVLQCKEFLGTAELFTGTVANEDIRAAVTHDGRSLIIVEDGKNIQCWDLTVKQKRWEFRSKLVGFEQLIMAPGSAKFTTETTKGSLIGYDLITGRRIEPVRPADFVSKAATRTRLLDRIWKVPNSDLEVGLESAKNYEYKIVGYSKKEPGKRFEFNKSVPLVGQIAFSHDGKSMASGDTKEKGLVRLWDVNSLKQTREMPGHRWHITALDFSSNDRQLLSGGFGGNLHLWDLNSFSEIKKMGTHAGEIRDIKFLEADTRALSASEDGTVRLWNLDSGSEILRFHGETEGNDWATVTPDLFYYGSKNLNKIVHFSLGLKIYTFDQFDLQYNRPDIILERLGKASKEQILAYRRAYEKRLRKMGFDPANFEKDRSFNVPELHLAPGTELFAETKNPEYTITFSAIDKLFRLDRLFVDVNGVPLFGVKGKSLLDAGSKETQQTITFQLAPGKNAIKVSVLNEKGVESLAERITVHYKPSAPIKPNLHVIVIGVSKFVQSDFNLTYADKDANDLAALLRSAPGYGSVTVHALTNENATKVNVLALRQELEKSSVHDDVIVFAASHGVLDDELDYYIAMHDMDFSDPRKGGLRYDELENLIDRIPARNKLVLIDACHSGEVDKEEMELAASGSAQAGSVKSRGFLKTVRSKDGIGLQNSFELMKELFADLRRNNGAVVISSASGKEYAFESAEWKNGVFTYSLIEALKNKKADFNKDQNTTVSELRDYVGKRVQELTAGKQNPTSRTENLENDFRVW